MATVRELLTALDGRICDRIFTTRNTMIGADGDTTSPYHRLQALNAKIQADAGYPLPLYGEALTIVGGFITEAGARMLSQDIADTLAECGVLPDYSNIQAVYSITFGVETAQALTNLANAQAILTAMQGIFTKAKIAAMLADEFTPLADAIVAAASTTDRCKG